MPKKESIEAILNSRRALKPAGGVDWSALRKGPAEGGCGVVGLASSERIAGRHLLQALIQMRNRGNGKGGGVAAVGLDPEQFGVNQSVLENDTLLAVAYLDPACRSQVERDHIWPTFEVDHVREAPQLADAEAQLGLDVPPPAVVQYFVRVRPDVYDAFQEKNGRQLSRRQAEGEIVFQNSYRLNRAFYAATGETRAFVLSHGKNLLVLKMVAYGDDVFHAYQLEDTRAHVWIGHHRYPTKGRVWHPGGAHPFVGLNEALVHNGDFANYQSIVEYLAQRGVYPLFLTDTEVSVQVFDLLYRTYGYPLEAVVEALAPTTERDFAPFAGRSPAAVQPDPAHSYALLAGRAVVLPHRPIGPRGRGAGLPPDGHHRYVDAAAAGVRLAAVRARRTGHRPGGLGEAGHRRRPGLACRGGRSFLVAGRSLLERSWRQPHRRRSVHLQRPAQWPRPGLPALQRQVRPAAGS